jgi:hypothetical protein
VENHSTVERNMADIVQTAANVKLLNATQVRTFKANGAITAGSPFTAHPTTGHATTDANASGYQAVTGTAMTSAADGETFMGHTGVGEVIDIGATGLTPGMALYASNNAGKVCPFADLTSGSRPILLYVVETATSVKAVYSTNTNNIP